MVGGMHITEYCIEVMPPCLSIPKLLGIMMKLKGHYVHTGHGIKPTLIRVVITLCQTSENFFFYFIPIMKSEWHYIMIRSLVFNNT